MREEVPCIAGWAVVLAHGAPGAFAEVGAPVLPRRPTRGFVEAGTFRRHGRRLCPVGVLARRAPAHTYPVRFGRELCGNLDSASEREWVIPDGLGGYAMGTMSGLRTRRYHGLLVVATRPPGGRMLGLAALDPILIIGERRIPLAVHEWASGAIDPTGHIHLENFEIQDGLPRWRGTVGDVAIEREIAMDHGRTSVAVVHRVLRALGPVALELHALCTWRD